MSLLELRRSVLETVLGDGRGLHSFTSELNLSNSRTHL